MVDDIGRQWTIATVAIGIVLAASLTGNAMILAAAGVAALVAGLVLLPRDRLGWPIIALVVGCLAAIGSALFGWDILT